MIALGRRLLAKIVYIMYMHLVEVAKAMYIHNRTYGHGASYSTAIPRSISFITFH